MSEPGQITPGALLGLKPTTYSTNVGTIGGPQSGIGDGKKMFLADSILDAGTSGPKGAKPPTGKPPCPAGIVKSYGQYWFEAIHVIPSTVDLGNILADVTNTFEVHSAYLSASKTLTVINEVNAAGIVITPPSSIPIVFGPSVTKVFQYDVSTSIGPPLINSLHTFVFGGPDSPTLTLTGKRAVIWPFPCENPMVEGLSFSTAIMEAWGGAEQRAMVRADARQTFNCEYLISDDRELATARNMLVGHNGRFFGLVQWQYARELTADISSGVTVIPVNTVDVDYRVGDQIVLWSAFNSFEVAVIVSFTASDITITLPTDSSHTALGTFVLPVQFAIANDDAPIERFENGVSRYKIGWASEDTADLSDITSFTLYKSKPLVDDLNFIPSGSLGESAFGSIEVMDFQTGAFTPIRRKTVASWKSSKTWNPENAADLHILRKFFYWTRGKLRSWWLPTFAKDFLLVNTIGSTDTTITVQGVEFTRLIGTGAAPYQDVYIKLNDGTSFTRAISNPMISGDNETIDIDSNLGQEVLVSEINHISFLMLVRFDTDIIQIKHEGQGRGVISSPVIGVQQ